MKTARILAGAAVATAATFAGVAAQAALLLHIEGGPKRPVPGDFELTFESAGGAGLVGFRIIGFDTLDGANVSNGLSDTFSLRLNGVEVLRGAWNLGGGGQNIVFLGDAAATALAQSPGFGRGGTVDITTPLTLAAGANTLNFAFTTAVPEAEGNEAWALGALDLNGPAGVPEPAAWAVMLLGFAGIGGALRRNRLALQK